MELQERFLQHQLELALFTLQGREKGKGYDEDCGNNR
jgi:hypothetical protein